MRDLSWKHVTVTVAFLSLVAAVVIAGKSEATLVVVGLAVLGGIGIVAAQQASNAKETQVVREQTNGTAGRHLDMLESQRREFTAMLEMQRLQLVSIIERQSAMLAGATVPNEVLALPASPAPVSPGRVPVAPAEAAGYGARPLPYPPSPNARPEER